MKKNKKILLIAATHGDEKIGVEVIEKLKKKEYKKWFDCLIANPKALNKNTRFIDVDLNRSYPGDKNSRLYEEGKAFQNLKKAKKYRYVIDLHEADMGMDNFIIIPKEKLALIFPIEFIDLEKVILWPSPRGPISQVLENAIELEFGMKNKNRKKTLAEAVKILEKFITAANLKKCPAKFSKKEIYYVYGKLLADKTEKFQLKDFKETKIRNEKFYPLLVGQYLNLGIACYKMKKIRFNSKFRCLKTSDYGIL